MNCSWCLQCYLYLTLSLLRVVRAVPPEYCLTPLNRSDCNAPPKTVFSYYKPGSRCEMETWRGCPTLNKFENEYLCTMNCIFRVKPVKVVPKNPCDIPLDQSQCQDISKTVFTHIDGSCEEVVWRGCPSLNMFNTRADCELECQVEPFEIKLEKLGVKTLDVINTYLGDIIEEEMITTEAVTEPTTETETVVTDAVSEEDKDATEAAVEADTEAATEAETEAAPEEEGPAVRPTVIDDYNS